MTNTTDTTIAHNLTPPLTPPLLSLKDTSSPIITPPAKPPVTVLRKVLTITDGRDKVLKLIQYFIKIILHHGLIAKRWPLHASLSALASQFSTTRKIIRLGHVIEPTAELYNAYVSAPKTLPATTKERISSFLSIMSLVFGIGNDLADDIFCLSKIGVLPAHWAKKAEPWSYRCWFAAILIDTQHIIRDILAQKANMREWQKIHVHITQHSSTATGAPNDISFRKTKLHDQLAWIDKNDRHLQIQEYRAMEKKLFWLRLSLVKTLMDGGFCGYDLFQCQFSNGFQAWTGFISGALSAYKLWQKNST